MSENEQRAAEARHITRQLGLSADKLETEHINPEDFDHAKDALTPELFLKIHQTFNAIKAEKNNIIERLKKGMVEGTQMVFSIINKAGFSDADLVTVVGSFHKEAEEVYKNYAKPLYDNLPAPHKEVGVRVTFTQHPDDPQAIVPLERANGFMVHSQDGKRRGDLVVHDHVGFFKVVQGRGFKLTVGEVAGNKLSVEAILSAEKKPIAGAAISNEIKFKDIKEAARAPANDFEKALGFTEVRPLICIVSAYQPGQQHGLTVVVKDTEENPLPNISFRVSRPKMEGENVVQENLGMIQTDEAGKSAIELPSDSRHGIELMPAHGFVIAEANLLNPRGEKFRVGTDGLGLFMQHLVESVTLELTLKKDAALLKKLEDKIREGMGRTQNFAQLIELLQYFKFFPDGEGETITSDNMEEHCKKCLEDLQKASEERRASLEKRKELATDFVVFGGIREKYLQLIDAALGTAPSGETIPPEAKKDVEAAKKAGESLAQELGKDEGASLFWVTKDFLKKHSDFIEETAKEKETLGSQNYERMHKKALAKLHAADPAYPDLIAAMLQGDQYTMRQKMREYRVKHGAENFTFKHAKEAIRIYEKEMAR